MAASGSWKKLKVSGAGDSPIVMTGDVYDSIVEAMNMFAAMEVAPMSNCGKIIANGNQFKLDLMDVDNRLLALESRVNVTGANVTCVGSNIVITYT